ncbi:hypothetical protein SNEBB_002068 [Seison nebaliae]|nr:hypothetical protein SNEBB_002068 [Seison nebaliae]
MFVNVCDGSVKRLLECMQSKITLQQKFLKYMILENGHLFMKMRNVITKKEMSPKFFTRIYQTKVLLERLRRTKKYQTYRSITVTDSQIMIRLITKMIYLWNLMIDLVASCRQVLDLSVLNKLYTRFLGVMDISQIDCSNDKTIYFQTEIFYFSIICVISLLNINVVIVRSEIHLKELYDLKNKDRLEVTIKYFNELQKDVRYLTLYNDITINTFSPYSILKEFNDIYQNIDNQKEQKQRSIHNDDTDQTLSSKTNSSK